MSHRSEDDPPITRQIWSVLFGATVSLIAATPAFSQDTPTLRSHHATVSGGVTWSGPYQVGAATATLRGNGPGASAPGFTFFTADARMKPAVAAEGRVEFALTPTLAIDGGINFARPRIGVAISRDSEVPAQDLDGEKLDQYQIGAGVTWQPPMPMRWRLAPIGRRIAPFVSGGAAYLRQLHEDRALAETGAVYHAGGGIRYWLRGGQGASMAVGVRAGARINVRQDGIDFENKRRIYPSVSVMLFVGL
jgi:hypothetical protein